MQIDLEKEKLAIEAAFEGLVKSAVHAKKDTATKKRIRKAFDVAHEAHKDVRRKSGEPYIFHPIAVARIWAGSNLYYLCLVARYRRRHRTYH